MTRKHARRIDLTNAVAKTVQMMETLEQRRMFAITAAFSTGTSTLTVIGDALPNTITISRNAAGGILVNGGAVAISGGVPTVANTALMQIFGQAGNDAIALDEANGALPAALMQGGTENDTLTGGSANDSLFGEAGNDVLFGKGGFDSLSGGEDGDSLTGGDADDQVFGDLGTDRMIWNPGDDTDLNEGGDGTDTVEVNGGNGAEQFTVTANGTRVRFDRVNPAPFSLDIGTTENLVVNCNGGDDSFSATGNLATLITITADGGAGNDTLLGSNGVDTLLGGDANDFIDGNQGNDVIFLGASDDTFNWDPGDGSDVVEGQDGNDTMLFNGANINERLDISANGGRVRFTRDVANIVMDLNDVERIDINALGGTDNLTVNDMTGTDLIEVNYKLASTNGGSTGDGAADNLIVNGTNSADTINVVGSGTSFSVIGLQTLVSVTTSEGANDGLTINALGGNDTIDASTLPAGVVRFTADGGVNNDSIQGSAGADVLFGNDDNDLITGNLGDDTEFLGAGNDTSQWDPGDGNDIVEGQTGSDTLLFNGSNANENIDISANGGRVRFTRDVGNIVMDLNDVETVTFNALGGIDSTVINDLTGTSTTRVNVDLAATGGVTSDGSVDSVIYNAPAVDDLATLSSIGGQLLIDGPAVDVSISNADPTLDRLTVNSQAGNDTVNASAVPAGLIGITFNGGSGTDQIVGSQGDDLINGGQSNDVILAGGGNDTLTWNPGDGSDTFEGQAGIDTMQFNGANINENIDISANGSRVRFTRDVAAITMDINGVETINFVALGGADTITVNSLAGTNATQVNIDLASTIGGANGDGAADTINLNGGAAADTINIAGQGADGLNITGTLAAINLTRLEGANDRLNVRGLGGADTIGLSSITTFSGAPITIDNEATIGSGAADGAVDQTIISFDNNNNAIGVNDGTIGTVVTGTPVSLTILHSEAANDSLRINALGGQDGISVNQNGASGAVRKVFIDAGDQTDTITITNTPSDGAAHILPSAGDDGVSVNNDGLFQANAVFDVAQRIGALSIGTNGFASVASGVNNVLIATSISLGGTAKLDLTNGGLMIDYTTTSPIATIRSLLTSGFAGGAWTGLGIDSSTAATTAKRTVGYAEASEVFTALPARMNGVLVPDLTTVLVRFTVGGDANLDGHTDSLDFNTLAANFGRTGRSFVQADFNYDNKTDSLDFNALASSFGLSLP